MNYLITGSSGFIGKNIIEYILNKEKSAKIVGIYRSKKIENNRIISVNADIRDLQSLEIGFKSTTSIDVVIHLASLVHNKSSDLSWENYKSINVCGSQNIFNLSLKYKIPLIIYLSSISVYGGEFREATEKGHVESYNYYSKSKLMVEELGMELYRKEGLPLVIIRPAAVYGAFDQGNLYKLIKAMVKGWSFRVSRGENLKSLCYIKNLLNFIEIIINNQDRAIGETYNIADEKPYKYYEIIDTIKKIYDLKIFDLKIPLSIKNLTQKFNLPGKEVIRVLCSDNSVSIQKAQRDLGYTPIYNLEKGLVESESWYAYGKVAKE